MPLILLGKKIDGSVEKGLAHRVVMELLSPLSNMGYRVYIDYYYSSPTLFLDLKDNGFDACGVIRTDRQSITLPLYR